MHTFVRRLKRFLRRGQAPGHPELSFELNGHVCSQPRFLPRKSGSVFSRAGRLCWRALLDGKPVKIYEGISEDQASFIEKLSASSTVGAYFPRCLMRIGSCLVVEWIPGQTLTWEEAKKDQGLLSRVAHLQAILHAEPWDLSADARTFTYIEYLEQRLHRFAGIFPLQEAFEKIRSTLDEDQLASGMRVSHPDFTARNIVRQEGTGALKIIDNELLTASPYYLIDLFNTYSSFGRRWREELLESYLTCYVDHGGRLAPLVHHERFFNALWHLRSLGSLLQVGAVAKALTKAQLYLEDPATSHPLLQLVKEQFR